MGRKKEEKFRETAIKIPLHLNKGAHVLVQREWRDRQLNNRNMTINYMLANYGKYQKYRARVKERILKMMRDWDIKPRDLE